MILTRRHDLLADAGATTATKDAVARGFHGKVVRAVGVVEDVLGRDNELTVLLAVEDQTLKCPLERVHGRSMDDTIAEVKGWRKADRVEVTGKLQWPSFEADMGMGIATAAVAPQAAPSADATDASPIPL